MMNNQRYSQIFDVYTEDGVIEHQINKQERNIRRGKKEATKKKKKQELVIKNVNYVILIT